MQLQPNDEQQQHDAEFSKMQNGCRVVDETHSPRADHSACNKIADNRPQPQPIEQGHGDNRCPKIGGGIYQKRIDFCCGHMLLHFADRIVAVQRQPRQDRKAPLTGFPHPL